MVTFEDLKKSIGLETVIEGCPLIASQYIIHPLLNPSQYIVPTPDGHISGCPSLAAALPASYPSRALVLIDFACAVCNYDKIIGNINATSISVAAVYLFFI